MLEKTASFHTTCEIIEDKSGWTEPVQILGVER
jgi:hypothetical protein